MAIPKRRWWLKVRAIKRRYYIKMRGLQAQYPFVYRVSKASRNALPKLRKLRGKHKQEPERARIYFANRKKLDECKRKNKPCDCLEAYCGFRFAEVPVILNDSWVSNLRNGLKEN